jgi:hypothetical protein
MTEDHFVEVRRIGLRPFYGGPDGLSSEIHCPQGFEGTAITPDRGAGNPGYN